MSRLAKVTVNLVPRASRALEDAAARTGDTKTVTINRALQLWAWHQQLVDAGARIRVVTADGQEREIELF